MEHIIQNSVFLVASPRMPSPARSTGEGHKDGLRIEEVRQIVLSDKLLRPLAALKTRLRRAVAHFGVPSAAMGAYIVPLERWEQCAEEVNAVRALWAQEVAAAAAALPQEIQELCSKYPKQADAILDNALSEQEFRKACGFIYVAYKVDLQQMLEAEGLTQELTQMERTVVDEMGKMVRDSKRDTGSASGATALSFLRALQEKAEGFAFVGQSIARVALHLKQCVMILPREGHVYGAEQALLNHVFRRLCDTEEVLKSGLGVAQMIEAIQLAKNGAKPAAAAKTPTPVTGQGAAKVESAPPAPPAPSSRPAAPVRPIGWNNPVAF